MASSHIDVASSPPPGAMDPPDVGGMAIDITGRIQAKRRSAERDESESCQLDARDRRDDPVFRRDGPEFVTLGIDTGPAAETAGAKRAWS